MNDGEVVPEGFVQMAKKIHGEDNEQAIAIAEEISNECAQVTHDDRCELAVLLITCAKMVFERHVDGAE